ncbi:hypothetical protein KI387_009663, partial [Taxus chinensis]
CGKEKLVNPDISCGSRQKSVLENAHRTAALSRAAVTGPRPCLGRRSRDPITEGQEAKERGKKGKTKGAGVKRGMRDVNAYSEDFSGSRTPCEETCIIIGALVTLFWQYSTLQVWART